ncbi:TcfC E-set like domain-containing protein [Vibrio crassostreae]|uniref:TcfC E-set like domain-containing protein n=1 Tax=Vibrio crassostreae TaxID=246167 RepID=UPI00352C40C1
MRKSYYYTLFSILIGSLFFGEVKAKNGTVPQGFDDFFTFKDTLIRLKNLDGSFSEPMLFNANYDTAKFENRDLIVQYLNVNDVKAEYHEEIIKNFENGWSNKSFCQGYVRDCLITPDLYEFLYNFNDKEIYFFVDEKILNLNARNVYSDYHSNFNDSPGFVNNVDAYFSAYSSQNSILTINDKATFGLPYGYVRSDLSVAVSSEKHNELTAYELSYNLDVLDKVIRAGYFKYSPEVNSTDFLLGFNSQAPQTAVVFGSSSNMLVSEASSKKHLAFFSPRSGDVEVQRDGKIIYQSRISEGKNTVNYSELPRGRYQVEIILRLGGETINRGSYSVYNNDTDTLSQGGIDYMLAFGQLSPDNAINDDVIDSDLFVQGRISYQLLPSLMIGSGLMKSSQDTALESGIRYSLLSVDSDISLSVKLFENANYINGGLSSNYGNINYERLDNQGSYLANTLHGDESYERIYLSTNYRFGLSSSFYATYSYNRKLDEIYIYGERTYEEENYNYDDLTIGYRFNSINKSTVDISFNTDFDTNAVFFNWTLPLSDSMDFSSSIYGGGDDASISQMTNSISKRQVFDSKLISNSLQVSSTYDRNRDSFWQSGTFSADLNNPFGRASTSAYFSSDGSVGISGSLSSSQILFEDGYVSSSPSNSYLVLDIDNKEKWDDDNQIDRGYLMVKRDGKIMTKKMIEEDQEVIPLGDYEKYEVFFDTESVDLYNTGDASVKLFTTPGSIATIKPNVHRKVSFISGFNDLNEDLVQGVTCKGEGCISINEITDGVYRVTVLEGLDFHLASEGGECFIPNRNKIVRLNLGLNYCLPTDYANMHEIELEGKGYRASYIGVFRQENIDNNEFLNQLKDYGYKIIKKNVGQTMTVVYVAQNTTMMNALFANYSDQLERLKKIVIKNSASNIKYPIVNN